MRHASSSGILCPWVILAAGLGVACGDDGSAGSADTSTGSTGSTTSSDSADPSTESSSSPTSIGPTSGPGSTGSADGTSTGGSTGSEGSTGGEPEGTFWVFVSAGGNVSSWAMDPQDGSLSLSSSVEAVDGVGPLAIDPAQQFLYAALGGQNAVQAYTVDPSTAALTPIASTPVGFNPVYLAVDPQGSHLLGATFGGDELAIFGLQADGSIGDETQRIAVPEEPHSIAFDPSEAWIVIPHRTPDIVSQWSYDPATGTVAAADPAQGTAPDGSGPRHVVFHPDGTHAYVSGEFDDTVLVFAFDSGTGALTFEEAVTTLPNGFDGDQNTVADIHITPDGRFVYASNRGHDSIAMFAVDPADHGLTELGQVGTEATPREFEISPRGRYLYAAGQDSGMLASYAIDPETGLLEAGEVYEVGNNPLWVLAVELPL